jgi:hypothetical protein
MVNPRKTSCPVRCGLTSWFGWFETKICPDLLGTMIFKYSVHKATHSTEARNNLENIMI